jgi:hypothetical protein
VLEKSVFDNAPIRHRNLPKAVGDEGRHQREARKRKSAEPAIKAGKDQRGADQLGSYRCERQRCRRREVDGLVETALEIGRTGREALFGTRAAF